MSSSIEQTLPPTHERRNSLEKHLQTRPDMQDLKNRHILLDTNVAPWVFPWKILGNL
jgi:hypothetical protein